MIFKNETQLKFLYGKDTVNALKTAVKAAIKAGTVKTVPSDILEDEEKLENYLRKLK